MQYVRLGGTGLYVSRLCLGMMSYGNPGWRSWVLDEAAGEPIVRAAVEAGVTFFDTADVYSLGGSEEVTGRLLGRLFQRREDYVLATKVHGPMSEVPNDRGLSRKHIMASIDNSLRRLGTEYVDLYQIHRWDPYTPIEETMRALDDVVRSGKARYIGASSMWAWQFAKAQYVARSAGWTEFVAMQNHYNVAYREEEREVLPLCLDMGVGVIPWSPLARGRLTRPPGAAQTDRSQNDKIGDGMYAELDPAPVVAAVSSVADARGVPMAQVALAWLLARPGVTAPIIGATRVGHLEDAVAACSLDLSADEAAALEAPYRPQPISGHD